MLLSAEALHVGPASDFVGVVHTLVGVPHALLASDVRGLGGVGLLVVQLDVVLDQRGDGLVVLGSTDASAGVLEDVGARVAER